MKEQIVSEVGSLLNQAVEEAVEQVVSMYDLCLSLGHEANVLEGTSAFVASSAVISEWSLATSQVPLVSAGLQ